LKWIVDLAILYFKQGNYAKAEEHYHRSLETYQKVFGPQHPDVGQSLLNIAQFYKATRTYFLSPHSTSWC
jgi:tetratricopeptide (TPR) repeat protein